MNELPRGYHATDELYFTPQELADHWKCHKETVYNLLRAGALHGFKLGRDWRIPASAVTEYQQDRKNQAGATYRRNGRKNRAVPLRVH